MEIMHTYPEICQNTIRRIKEGRVGFIIIKTTRKIKDKYNDNKVWIITRTKCGHYYFTQEICERQYCRKVRTTKKHLHELFPEWY